MCVWSSAGKCVVWICVCIYACVSVSPTDLCVFLALLHVLLFLCEWGLPFCVAGTVLRVRLLLFISTATLVCRLTRTHPGEQNKILKLWTKLKLYSHCKLKCSTQIYYIWNLHTYISFYAKWLTNPNVQYCSSSHSSYHIYIAVKDLLYTQSLLPTYQAKFKEGQ